MKALLSFVDRHPLWNCAVGTSGGFGAWILAHLGLIQTVASAIGAVFGAAVAIGTFLLMLPKLWRLWLQITGRRPKFPHPYEDDELP